jgi:hypothetical protein
MKSWLKVPIRPVVKTGDIDIIKEGIIPVVNPQNTPIKKRDTHSAEVYIDITCRMIARIPK